MAVLPHIRNRLLTSQFWLDKYVRYRKSRWDKGDRSPWAASLKVTWRCNLHCNHCFWRDFHLPKDLPTAAWYRIIDSLAKIGCVEVVIEGGEPTLRDDFYDLVEYAKNRMLRVNVVSNGQMPIKTLNINRLYISLDGLKDTHDHLRGKGTFAKVDETIEGYGKKDELILLVSMWQGNYNEIEDILEYFNGRVGGFWISFLYQTPRIENVSLSQNKKKNIARKLLKLKESYPILNSDLYLKTVGKGIKCHDWVLATVLADGSFAKTCYPKMFGGKGCVDCDLACYKEIDIGLYPEYYERAITIE